MKRENEKWVNRIKDRLENYVEPMPVGGWNALEKELAPVSLASSFKWKRMMWAAAVVLALLTSVGGWMLHLSDEEVVRQVASYSEQIPALPQTDGMEKVILAPEPKQSALAQAGRAQQNVDSFVANRQMADVKNSDTQKIETDLSLAEDDKDVVEKQDMQDESAIVKKTFSKKTVGRSRDYASVASVSLKKLKDSNWSVAMAYSNSLGVRSNSFPGYSTLNLASYSQVKDPIQDDFKIPQKAPLQGIGSSADDEFPQTEVTHKTPVAAGVSFRYKINRQFAIETGLNYTLLSSELRAGTNQIYYVESYKFHYLGIPLKASWTFLDIPYLSLYLSAGGELEKSLAGKYKKMFVGKGEKEVTAWNDNIKPVQWSVLGSLGVQLNLNPHLGIYAEPGVVYYFDDGSRVQTIRKDKPLNFKMQLGVRWTY